MSGVSKETISEVERGLRTPNPLTLGKLAAALNVGIDEIEEEIKTPKGQAPSPPDTLNAARRTLNYDSYAEVLKDFCVHWESKYEAKDIDRRALQEFRRDVGWITPMLKEAQVAELNELRTQLGREPTLDEPSLWHFIDQYMAVIHKVRELGKEEYGEDDFQEAQVIQMRRAG
jgi:transcriptional regulator with XRE-family HTH domain